MARRSYYADEIEAAEEAEAALQLGQALTGMPVGMPAFKPLPAWGSDPSQIGWPPTLPLELALGMDTPKEVCSSYGLTREDFVKLGANAAFVKALEDAQMTVSTHGLFKARAMLQANELLKTMWARIHDPKTPAVVAADLMKYTIRVAGLDASKDQGQNKQGAVGNFAIQINLA